MARDDDEAIRISVDGGIDVRAQPHLLDTACVRALTVEGDEAVDVVQLGTVLDALVDLSEDLLVARGPLLSIHPVPPRRRLQLRVTVGRQLCARASLRRLSLRST